MNGPLPVSHWSFRHLRLGMQLELLKKPAGKWSLNLQQTSHVRYWTAARMWVVLALQENAALVSLPFCNAPPKSCMQSRPSVVTKRRMQNVHRVDFILP